MSLTVGMTVVSLDSAWAASPGCAAVNAGSVNTFTFNEPFFANETLTFTFIAAGGSPGNFQYSITQPVAQQIFSGGLNGPTTVATFRVPFDAVVGTNAATVGAVYDILINCIAITEETAQQSAANAAAAGSINQTAGLIGGRIQSITRPAQTPSSLPTSTSTLAPTVPFPQTGLVDLSAGRIGAAAGGDQPRWGVWANFSWTGIEDRTAVAGQDGDVATGIVGADYQVGEGFIAGGALSLGGANFESSVSAFETGEVNIGLNAYAAYRVTDQLSIDAIAGYSFGVGDSTRAETITGHYDIHRYFVSANASLFETWDRVSLLASVGVLWGQSFEGAYYESDGTQIGSRRADLGSVRVLAQPGYLFDLDPETGLFLETYVLGEYNYDFTLSRIAGHNNDRDAFRLGAGMTLFSGDALSANVEASTMLGRDQQGAINVQGTLRYTF